MEFVQGINFHSSKGFKYLISSGYQPYDFATDRYIAELLRVQSYSVPAGQKFFFVYPIRTPQGNKQVFGSGEIVRSRQEDRPVLVPFVQYFACNLSDAVNYNMNFTTFFKQYGSSYQDVFSKSQTGENVTPQKVTIQPSPEPENQYSELQESFGLRGSKTKRYVNSLEEGLEVLNSLMLSPDVVRWAFSVILTPLDGEYPENNIIVYGQPPKLQMNQAASSSLIRGIYSGNQKEILEGFFEYIKGEKKIDSATPNLSLLDNLKLEELEESLREFVKGYSRKEEKNVNVEKSREDIILFTKIMKNKAASNLDLMSLDGKLIAYETKLSSEKAFLKAGLAKNSDISKDEILEGVLNFPADTLKTLLDGKTEVKIRNLKLRDAMQMKINASSSVVAQFWSPDIKESNPSLIAMGKDSLIKGGPGPFTSIGTQKTTELIGNSNFDEAVKGIALFTLKLSVPNRSPSNIDAAMQRETMVKGVSALQEVLLRLQDRLVKLENTAVSYYISEQALISTVSEYLTSIIDYEKKNGNLNLESNYNGTLGTLRLIIETAEKKQRKALDTQYEELKEIVKTKKTPILFRIFNEKPQ